jgi:hypothetical protein
MTVHIAHLEILEDPTLPALFDSHFNAPEEDGRPPTTDRRRRATTMPIISIT